MNNYFPVTHSVLAATSLKREFLPTYDIGTVQECTFLNRGVNDTYLVKTPTDRYILRVYRTGWRSQSDILYEVEALLHLKRQGVPVSIPLASKDGELLHTVLAPEGPRTLVLFTYAPGKEPDYEAPAENPGYLYGRSVAQIHAGTAGFQSQQQRFALDLEHLLTAPLQSIQSLLHHRAEDWVYLQTLAERLRQDVLQLPLEGLERGFCHGDFHGWNAHIEPDGTHTFYDFDCCGVGWRAYDIAVFRWGARLADKEKERWPHFLRGYQEVRPLAALDLQATNYFVAIRQFWLLGLHTGNGADWGFGWMNDGYFDHSLKFFCEWEAEQAPEKADAG